MYYRSLNNNYVSLQDVVCPEGCISEVKHNNDMDKIFWFAAAIGFVSGCITMYGSGDKS